MNIRQLKNRLVDIILDCRSSVEETTTFGDSSESWVIKNSIIAASLKFTVSGEGVTISYEDAFDEMEEFVEWEAFPSSYKEEIVSCLTVETRIGGSEKATALMHIFN